MKTTDALHVDLGELAGVLDIWSRRDDTKPEPEVRDAASAAVGAIDRMLRDLHWLREQLISEIRVSDDASLARAEALIAKYRGARS